MVPLGLKAAACISDVGLDKFAFPVNYVEEENLVSGAWGTWSGRINVGSTDC